MFLNLAGASSVCHRVLDVLVAEPCLQSRLDVPWILQLRADEVIE
jgi:hypothetical protein